MTTLTDYLHSRVSGRATVEEKLSTLLRRFHPAMELLNWRDPPKGDFTAYLFHERTRSYAYLSTCSMEGVLLRGSYGGVSLDVSRYTVYYHRRVELPPEFLEFLPAGDRVEDRARELLAKERKVLTVRLIPLSDFVAPSERPTPPIELELYRLNESGGYEYRGAYRWDHSLGQFFSQPEKAAIFDANIPHYFYKETDNDS